MLLVCFMLVFLQIAGASQNQLSSSSEYRKYIDALLGVKDFGTHYYEDGAADATVLFPSSTTNPYGRPADAVVAIVRLRQRSLPLLIDCLSDTRVTTVVFDGNRITKAMNVPLGYVCLDILMQTTEGNPVSDPECADDGPGACMNLGFYFRPDDYENCWKDECLLRPWVKVVQRNWKRQYLARRLRFRNPYDQLKIEEYKDLMTPQR
jgi:hypothetical protein